MSNPFLITKQKIAVLGLAACCLLASCDGEKDDPKPAYNVPETYSFTNVKYEGQTIRLQLLDSLAGVLKGSVSQKVTAQQLKDIFENTGGFRSADKKLSDKCEADAKTQIYAWFDSVEVYSGTQPNSPYLFTAGGLDLSQLIQKTAMGSVFYYRAVNDYLLKLDSKDNSVIVPGEGTAREHAWDEAFGYYGAPVDFKNYTDADVAVGYRDSNGNGKQDKPTEKPYYHANYSLTRDRESKPFTVEADKSNYRVQIMEAFLKGRAAITNKDDVGMNAAKNTILELWEKQTAASALHYINEYRNLTDVAKKNHAWAEGKAFANVLRFSNAKKITTAEVDQLIGYFKAEPGYSTTADWNNAKALLKKVYGFSDYQLANM